MLFLPKSKSYLLFALLCLTFFSCQHLIEIIEPTPPKQIEQTCRLINDVNNNGDTTRYSHNKLGRLQRTLFDQGSNTTAENRFLRNFFTYNEKNQLIRLFNVQWRQGFSHDIAYDAAGRVAKVET